MTETISIPILHGVCAGRGIPDDLTDWEIAGHRDVRVDVLSDSQARYAWVRVDGFSLEKKHIIDGDLLLTRITRTYADGHLGIWQTPHGRTAKYGYYDPDGFIVLHNDDGWRQTWEPGEVTLFGLVERIERDAPALI